MSSATEGESGSKPANPASPGAALKPPIPLHFVTPVWGREYTRVFLEVTLPTLLAPGNIPSVPNLAECVYRIYTTPEDEEVIRGSAAYAKLSALVRVDFVHIPQLDENKYVASSDCYREGLMAAARAGAAVFTAVPDVVFADGGIASVARLLRAGKRAVFVMGLRAVKDSLVPELMSRWERQQAIVIQPRELASLLTRHLHPIGACHLYDADTPGFHPSVLCWRVGGEGFVLHSFHLHPIAVLTGAGPLNFGGTIDDDLISNLGFRDDEVHIVDDSDEFLCGEISDRNQAVPTPPRNTTLEIVSWMSNATGDYHRVLVQHPLRIHSADTSGQVWRAAESRAREVVTSLLAAYRRRANPNPEQVPLHFVTPVWGGEYTRLFLELTLPTLLSPGNIPSVPNLADCVYRIYTTPADAEIMRASAVYARLNALVAVDFVYLRDFHQSKYATSSDCYRAALRDAAFEHSAAVLLIPDMVFADGGIRSIERLLRAGKRAVLVMGLRAFKESLVPAVQAAFSGDDGICVPPRELVRLGARNLHSIVETHMYEGNTPAFNPSLVCWRVADEGFLLHGFHLHPVAVYPREQSGEFFGTIDDDLIQAAGFSDDEVHVVADSDELVWFEVSGREHLVPAPTSRDVREVAKWMAWTTNEHHRHVVRTPIRIHSGTGSVPAWLDAEKRGREVVELFLSEYARSWAGVGARVHGLKRRILGLELRAKSYLDFQHVQPTPSVRAALKRGIATAIVRGLRTARTTFRSIRGRRPLGS